jgi:hypothetical protein
MVEMKTQIAATYVGGQFKPDEVLPLAESTRVNLTIEVIEDEGEPDPEFHGDPQKSIAAWEALKAFLKKHPIHGGGKKYTRDELYERR